MAAFDDERRTRLKGAASGFAKGGGGVSRSCAEDFGGPARRDGSLFMGTSVRRKVGDVGDATRWAGGGGTLAPEGDVLVLADVWDVDSGDGVYCRAW